MGFKPIITAEDKSKTRISSLWAEDIYGGLSGLLLKPLEINISGCVSKQLGFCLISDIQ